jgi:hypothetical protein
MEEQEKGSGKAGPGLGIVLVFVVLWFLAMYLSCLHLRTQGTFVFGGGEPPDTALMDAACVLGYAIWPPSEDAHESPATEEGHRVVAGAGEQQAHAAVVPSSTESFAERCRRAYERASESMNKHLTSGLHPEQTLAGALLKFVVVCALCALWFCTFLVANPLKAKFFAWYEANCASKDVTPTTWQRIFIGFVAGGIKWSIAGLALVPAVYFSLAMYRVYEPAVFVMALAAIYVAAEHYGGLIQTEHELQERTAELKRTLGTVLDADGLYVWRREVYALYRRATWRIDGVVRSLDIDLEWWKCAGKPKPWDDYIEQSEADSGSYTLLSVMGASRAKVKFAVDLPLPIHSVRPECPKSEKNKFFRDLLGLAWSLVVFDLAFKQRQKQAKPNERIARLRMKLTHAPSWMHVVDYTVYQMIERAALANSTVRELTHSLEDPEERRLLSRWARENVRTFARRGGLAEEYVFSVLRYAAYQMPGVDEGARLDLRGVLNILGMQEYLDEPKEEFVIAPEGRRPVKKNMLMLDRPDVADLCVAVFEKLIEIELDAPAGSVRVRDLIRELL